MHRYRYWGHEHNYTETLIDIKRGGVVLRQRPYLYEELGPRNKPMDVEDQIVQWINEPEPEESDFPEFDGPIELDAMNEEPLGWVAHEMCVQDPFIRAKASEQSFYIYTPTNTRTV